MMKCANRRLQCHHHQCLPALLVTFVLYFLLFGSSTVHGSSDSNQNAAENEQQLEKLNERQLSFIKDLQRKAMKGSFSKVKDPDEEMVEECFYDHSWLFNKTHHCYPIAVGDRNRLTRRALKRRNRFQQLIARDKEDRKLVQECFYQHRFDRHPKCWDISWGGRDLLHNSPPTSRRQARLRNMWQSLVNEEYRREMHVANCAHHPWQSFEECTSHYKIHLLTSATTTLFLNYSTFYSFLFFKLFTILLQHSLAHLN